MNLGIDLNGGELPLIPPNATVETQIGAINDVITRINSLNKFQIFSDSQNKRMIIGYQKNGWGDGKDFGIKISAEGVDVTTATDEQLIFSMDMETWRWFDPDARNYVNIGLRSTGTYGFEMAKPGEALDDPA